MTTKEMLTAVINGTINDEVKAKATEMLAAAEKKNGKRAEVSAENCSANATFAAEMFAAMINSYTKTTDETKTADETKTK